MSQNSFAVLLREFRDGHAEYGGGGFELFFPEDNQTSGYHASPACEFLGTIFLRDAGDSRIRSCVVFGNFRGRNWAISDDAFELFASLARRAGAHLPLAIQREFSVKPNDPTGAWLTFMYQFSPPYENQFQGPTHWPEPFLSAANAIELGGLDLESGKPAATKRGTAEPALADLIPIPWLRGVVPKKHVGGSSSHLAAWIRRRGHALAKIAGKLHCERAVALELFPRQKKYIEAYLDKPQ